MTKKTIREQMLELLSDGEPHARKELQDCCEKLSSLGAVAQHLLLLRREIPENQLLLCRLQGKKIFYQLVNKLVPN